ncbi:DUF296 domain-containing protein [Actinoplanes oblitus]|uniref:DUF296 domain-containing protein n=1 Tax=Actinoplanes oblitus TaxID=3040509 RepID=A0ABY8WAY6_9ACTN|nr:DUF296 domain-containing protein [Actinoplanes oblitus]WIM94263.1 DUF296 domain-containing protein [Actinoplanes oblitus]
MHLIKVEKDQEVLATIGEAVANLGVTNGSLTLIGAVHEARVSVMHRDDAMVDRMRSYAQPFEMSGTGEIVNGEVHIHAWLAGEDLIVAGHAHELWVRDFFVRAYLNPL